MSPKERYATDAEYRARSLAANRKWRGANKERVKQYLKTRKVEKAEENKRWRLANSEKHRANARKWYEENKERAKASRKVWHENNRDKHRGYFHARRERMAQTESCDKQSRNVLTQLIAGTPRLRCGVCEKVMPRNDRTVDHVIPLVRGGTGHIANLRVVHKRCNSRKSYLMPEDFCGQSEINFAGNGAQPNTIRVNRANRVQVAADSRANCHSWN